MGNVISHERLWFFRKRLAVAQTVFLKKDARRQRNPYHQFKF